MIMEKIVINKLNDSHAPQCLSFLHMVTTFLAEFELHTFFILSRNRTGGCLYTCAVRPAAIYGPGEDRHLPRIIAMARLGLILFRIGDKTVKSDWVFVDNLVLALILASMGLLDDIPGKEKRPIAAGQAYFISDGILITISLLIYKITFY